MSSSTVNSSVSFIDLATFGEMEGFLYGGCRAVTWFVAAVQKGNWFSQIPISLRNVGASAQFGSSQTSFSLSRQGDYVLSAFLRVLFPSVGFKTTVTGLPRVRWTKNLMHNLVRHAKIEFNDLTVQEFSNYWLDDVYAFRCPAAKRIGYQNMIGAVSTYTTPVGPGTALGGGYLSLPLPFFFQEDSGVALPVAALPFNDIKLTFTFRDWKNLLIVDPAGTAANISSITTYVNGVAQDTTVPTLSNVECYAHYAVVHNDERVKMGDAPRDILIHQIQETQNTPFKDVSSRSSFDIRLSHAISMFTFKAQNTSLYTQFAGQYGEEHSNYTTLSEVYNASSVAGSDPISHSHLFYENSVRLSNHSDYFALINPWYYSEAIPEETGYHMYSYALHPWDPVRPSGSTDFSKLANVSIAHDSSTPAIRAAAGFLEDGTTAIAWPISSSPAFRQTFHHVFCARNWNILRVANGSVGFPSL